MGSNIFWFLEGPGPLVFYQKHAQSLSALNCVARLSLAGGLPVLPSPLMEHALQSVDWLISSCHCFLSVPTKLGPTDPAYCLSSPRRKFQRFPCSRCCMCLCPLFLSGLFIAQEMAFAGSSREWELWAPVPHLSSAWAIVVVAFLTEVKFTTVKRPGLK